MTRRAAWVESALNGSASPRMVARLDDPHALHLIAIHHNWDDGVAVPKRLAEHSRLDRGTALHLFWLVEPPETLLAVGRPDEDECSHPFAGLVDQLRMRLVDGAFRSADIAVDPRRDLSLNRLMLHRLHQSGVPSALIGPTPGHPFDESTVLRRYRG